MAMPNVAIVVPTYNASSTLRELLVAFAEQTDTPPFELVLADNGSTDDTHRIAEQFQDRVNVHWVDASGDNRGPAYARHVGVQSTSAGHLLFIDQDDVPSRGYVGAMSRALESSPFVYSEVDVERLNPVWLWSQWAQKTPIFVAGWPVHLGGTLGIRRDVYEKSGGWSEDPWLDDGDFCFRVFLTLGSAPTRAEGALLHYRYRTDPNDVFRQRRRWGRIAARTNRKFRPRGYKVESEWTMVKRAWRLARSARAVLNRTDRYFWMAELGYILGRSEMDFFDMFTRYMG